MRADVRITSGICGFVTIATVQRGADKKLSVTLKTDCEMVRKMAPDIAVMDWKELFVGFAANVVYKAASRHLRHVACPVPCGILKAAEVAAEVCLKKNVSIEFVSEDDVT